MIKVVLGIDARRLGGGRQVSVLSFFIPHPRMEEWMNGRYGGSTGMLTQSYQVFTSANALSRMVLEYSTVEKIKKGKRTPDVALSDDHRKSPHLSARWLPQQVKAEPQPTGTGLNNNNTL